MCGGIQKNATHLRSTSRGVSFRNVVFVVEFSRKYGRFSWFFTDFAFWVSIFQLLRWSLPTFRMENQQKSLKNASKSAVLVSSVPKATQNARAFFQRRLELTWKNLDFLENCLQNLKKFRAKNVAEWTDYDGFRAEIHLKNSTPGLIKTENHELLERSIFKWKSTNFSWWLYWKWPVILLKVEVS
jgi:hypothetical protein